MKLLAVIDMQNDFVDGALGSPDAQAIVPNVCNKIFDNANKDTILIYTYDTHGSDYMNTLEGYNLPVPHCVVGTEGWEINPEVKQAIEFDYKEFAKVNYFCKKTFGGEMGAWLNAIEDSTKIDEIEICGLCTGICVLSNAIILRAMFPNAEITVDSSCCACVTPESHKNALEAMKLCQIDII